MLSKLFHRIKQAIDRKRMRVFTSIDFLPVWNFYRVIETEDTRYLFKLKDYERLPDSSYVPSKEWAAICEQYFKESIGLKYFQYRTLRLAILRLRNKFTVLSNSIYVLSSMGFAHRDKELVESIRGIGYQFNEASESEFADSLISLNQQLKGLHMAIRLKQREYDSSFLSKGKAQDIYEMIGNIEQWKGFKIDVFSLTVRQFLNYQKTLSKEVTRQRARQFSKEVSHG